ncbi:MAG: ABC transporter ATP-binding protein [Ottowia sp.]
MTTLPALALHAIGHRYGPATVLEGVDLQVPPGEVVALLGRSGCGKTTLLRIAAGLLTPSEGRVDTDFSRHAIVFQQPSLLPWQRLLDNIALGLKARGLARAERRARAATLAAQVGLTEQDHAKYPAELSGGMQSRAALARAFAVEPALLLMDEPFSALDVGLRAEMHALLAQHIHDHAAAALLVTHDVMDAVRLAHGLVFMVPDPGRVLVRFGMAQPLNQRDDEWVFHHTALLMAHPLVRQAFSLPPLTPEAAASAQTRLAASGIHMLACPAQATPVVRGAGCG